MIFELRDAEGAFAASEDYLAGERFRHRRDVVADLLLAYGLSAHALAGIRSRSMVIGRSRLE